MLFISILIMQTPRAHQQYITSIWIHWTMHYKIVYNDTEKWKIVLFKIVLLINEVEPIMGFKIKPIYLLLYTVREFSLPEFASTQNFGFYSLKKLQQLTMKKKLCSNLSSVNIHCIKKIKYFFIIHMCHPLPESCIEQSLMSESIHGS